MTGARLEIYEDGLGRLGALTDLRAAAEVRTGALTTRERVERLCAASAGAMKAGTTLAVNGRCVIPPSEEELKALSAAGSGGALVEAGTGEVIAAAVSASAWEKWKGRGELDGAVKRVEAKGQRLVRRPWDVVSMRDAALVIDLSLLSEGATQELPEGVVAIGEHELTIAPDAVVYPTVVLDAEHGPIVIASGAVVRPGAIISGPAYVGERSTVVERAHIKADTAIGPVCKVGGEIGGTIFQGYSNKGHEGHLGDSWVGEWVNLGAGTVNSNLLNTYGEVTARAEHGAPNERTGLNFFGCVLGDHVKTAIGTRIMTGASVGTGTMWAASAAVTGAVGRFRWVTDAGERAHGWERFEETMRAMMGRRKMVPPPEALERLRALHAEASR